MPRGQYDRSKTKAQRDAEKAAGVKAVVKTKGKTGPKKVIAKKAFKGENSPVKSDISRDNSGGVFFRTDIAINVRMETLMDYATCLANIIQAKVADTSAELALTKCLERMEFAIDEVQPLGLEEPAPVKESLKEYLAKHEEAPEVDEPEEEIVAPPAPATPPAPVVRSAPIPFNPAVPSNGG